MQRVVKVTAAPTILVVDNDEFDQICFKRVWDSLRFSNPVAYAHDGLEALEKLRGENNQKKLGDPCIIFLDLDMPKMNGLEFLKLLRIDKALKHLKVYIYTGTIKDTDVKKADALGVEGFVLKEDIEGSLKEILQDSQITFQLVA